MSDNAELNNFIANANKHSMSRSELIDYVKEEMGYPTVNVELTPKQLDHAIDDALDEIRPYYTVFRYMTTDIVGGKGCIDLTPYKVMDVTDVIKVFEVSATPQEINPFAYSSTGNLWRAIPSSSMLSYSYSRIYNQNIHTVISNFAKANMEMLYSRLAWINEQRMNKTLTENKSWKYYDGKLYVDTGYPNTSVITIEYIPDYIDVPDIDISTRYGRYLKKLSIAFALSMQARITGKHNVQGSPVQTNYSTMRDDSHDIIDEIRKELKATANVFYITD